MIYKYLSEYAKNSFVKIDTDKKEIELVNWPFFKKNKNLGNIDKVIPFKDIKIVKQRLVNLYVSRSSGLHLGHGRVVNMDNLIFCLNDNHLFRLYCTRQIYNDLKDVFDIQFFSNIEKVLYNIGFLGYVDFVKGLLFFIFAFIFIMLFGVIIPFWLAMNFSYLGSLMIAVTVIMNFFSLCFITFLWCKIKY